MADTLTYGKPNMASLPPALGKKIIQQILSTPVPDQEKIHVKAKELEKKMVEIRESEDVQGTSSK